MGVKVGAEQGASMLHADQDLLGWREMGNAKQLFTVTELINEKRSFPPALWNGKIREPLV